MLANSAGMKVAILSYGGIIQSIEFPDRKGEPGNVVLGFKTLPEYVAYNPAPTPSNTAGTGAYFGALIGRYANRIGGGRFSLGGTHYAVPPNNGPHALHGGEVGFDQKVWESTAVRDGTRVGVRLKYVSADGEMGFPGALETVATYELDEHNRLSLTFEAIAAAPTVLNLTNHTYWNLAGEGSGDIYDQLLCLKADSYTPVDDALIPTGETAPVAGTPFDFRQLAPIGARIRDGGPQLLRGHGYDHNWVVRQTNPPSLVLAATATDPVSGRGLNVYTTQPGLQFYSGNFLNGTVIGSSGRSYRQGDGFALETQHFPDAPNHPEFPGTTLGPGQAYEERTVFELFRDGVDGR
jgi:aldose 1-epimerase